MGYLIIIFAGIIGYFLALGALPFAGILIAVLGTLYGGNELHRAKAKKFRKRRGG